MNRRYRLTSSTEFRRVRREGKSYAHPLSILITCANGRAISRFGITASKSIGNAVRRNKAKRLLREALRGLMPSISDGWDVILIARSKLLDADWQQIQTAISSLLRRADLLECHDDPSSGPSTLNRNRVA
jgi:ribonuclease P protein component